MKTLLYMPVKDLQTKDYTSWVARAVQFGIIPDLPEVMAEWLELNSNYVSGHAKKILENTPSSFEPKPGFKPLAKDSDAYVNFEMNESENLADRIGWNFSQWSKNDPDGLLNIQNAEPERFKELYNSEFKKKEVGKEEPKKNMIPSGRNDWSWSDWSKKDPDGLNKLRNDTPSLYKALYDLEFKK